MTHPSRVPAAAVLVALALTLTAACTPSRSRPGPPSLQIQTPAGSMVFSPDTLHFAVVAQDPDGLDSVRVTVLDSTTFINTNFDTESATLFSIPVPGGLAPGALITIFARATDITGEQTVATASVTVVQRPPT